VGRPLEPVPNPDRTGALQFIDLDPTEQRDSSPDRQTLGDDTGANGLRREIA
jgi:hypothetical protein